MPASKPISPVAVNSAFALPLNLTIISGVQSIFIPVTGENFILNFFERSASCSSGSSPSHSNTAP